MEIKAQLNNLRTAPRKVRQLVDVIRNKDVAQARALLDVTVKRSAEPVLKLLNSAVASAVNNFKLEESSLYISKITVDEGPKLKRSFPMSRGRAYPIMKRTSHIALTLSEIPNPKSQTPNKPKSPEVKRPTRKTELKKIKPKKLKS